MTRSEPDKASLYDVSSFFVANTTTVDDYAESLQALHREQLINSDREQK